MILIWGLVFIFSIVFLVGGAEWLLQSAQKIGLKIGFSPFVIGITIVAFGTSLPELISGVMATVSGVSDFAISNAVGSNIANILLAIGIATLFARKLQVTKDLINLDLPLLAISTSIFLIVAMDGTVNFFEALFLIATYVIYLGFVLIYKEEDETELEVKSKISYFDILKLGIGSVALYFGAKYLIESVVMMASIWGVGSDIIAITAVAVGTSLPEIVVSTKAAIRRQPEIALGNVFGSNIFNILMVVGIPGLFSDLTIGGQTFLIGLPVLIVSTLLFVISGISRRIHIQEGALFFVLYILFVAKLFNLF